MKIGRIGRVAQAVKKGDRVTVYFNHGDSGSFIAQHDITSSKVAVIDNLVFSEDNAVPKLSETTRLFKSKGKNLEEANFPWAYLFEINEFEDLSTPFTDEVWNYDDIFGVFRPYGDGGGEWKTEQEIRDHYGNSPFVDATLGVPYYRFIVQKQFSFNILNALQGEEAIGGIPYVGIPPGQQTTIANTDGVYYGNLPIRFNNETIGAINAYTRYIYPDRQYWVEERVNQNQDLYWGANWNYNGDTGEPGEFTVEGIGVIGNAEGSYRQVYSISNQTRFSDPLIRSNWSYAYIREEDGTTREIINTDPLPGETITESNNRVRNLGRAARDSTLGVFNSLFEPVTYTMPDQQYQGQIYTGQQIINGAAGSPYIQAQGNIPAEFNVGSNVFSLSIGSEPRNVLNSFYQSFLYLIPITAERYPGKKEIFAQIGNNKKTLLHTIPFTELYEAFISALSNNEIEVVLFCGKKLKPDGSLANRRNNRSGINLILDREWSQVRIYKLNGQGTILDETIANNSGTVLNPGSTAQNFELDDRNWQKPWLNTFADFRTAQYRIRDLVQPFHLWQHIFGTGEQTDLSSAYRSFYSLRNTTYVKTIDETSVIRVLIEFASYGTLTPQGFVYLEPDDLYDPNVDLDFSFSFGTRLKPAPNYAILQGLANQSTQNKMYRVNAEFSGGNLVNQIIVELTTNFPKLDLPEGLGDLQAGIKAICFLGSR